MTNQEIFDLMARFDGSGIQTLRLSQGDFTIELGKDGSRLPDAGSPGGGGTAAVPAASTAETGLTITAPLVGTLYAAPAPEQPPFVSVGDKVKQGDTVCLLEAMKTMVEVPAPCDCLIEEILKTNGELAAFGEALMRYTPC